jgi:hypothetical protein
VRSLRPSAASLLDHGSARQRKNSIVSLQPRHAPNGQLIALLSLSSISSHYSVKMMSPLDAVGLALAIFPVVTEILGWYSSKFKGRDVKHLAESLKNCERIFMNSIEYMLLSTGLHDNVEILLGDLRGDAWKEKSLNDLVTAHLGEDADRIFAIIDDIRKTVSKLEEKLPVCMPICTLDLVLIVAPHRYGARTPATRVRQRRLTAV